MHDKDQLIVDQKSLCYFCLPYVFDSIRGVKNKCIAVVSLSNGQVSNCIVMAIIWELL